MKQKFLAFIIFNFMIGGLAAQNIRLLAAYDNNSSYTSGIFALGDTALYRYSWYFQSWFPLANTGLVKINDTVKISALAVYNNESSNSSGLFVFSDTAVYNYNWITAQWYPLSNSGLPRDNQKPIVRSLSVYGPAGSSSNSTVIALSDTAVFRYSWFYQYWTFLSNDGLVTFMNADEPDSDFSAVIYPNPFKGAPQIELMLPEGTHTVELAVFDVGGRLVHQERFDVDNLNHYTIRPDFGLLPRGLYFCELTDGKTIKILKVIQIE